MPLNPNLKVGENERFVLHGLDNAMLRDIHALFSTDATRYCAVALHKKFKIPPTEVGGSFRSFLRNAFHVRHSQIPPTAVGGWFSSFLPRRRVGKSGASNGSVSPEANLNNPPTAVDGILNFLCKAPRCGTDLSCIGVSS